MSGWEATKRVAEIAWNSPETQPILLAPLGVTTATRNTISTLATKAGISIGTQTMVNQDVNLVKLGADMFLNSIGSAIIGNSSQLSIKNMLTNKGKVFNISSPKDFATGVAIDAIFIGRNGIYKKAGISGAGKSVIEVQSEIISQGISRGIQEKSNK